jgi:hypothetical protein
MCHCGVFNGASMAQINLRHYYWAPTHGVIMAQGSYYPHGNGAPVAQWRTDDRSILTGLNPPAFSSIHLTRLSLYKKESRTLFVSYAQKGQWRQL